MTATTSQFPHGHQNPDVPGTSLFLIGVKSLPKETEALRGAVRASSPCQTLTNASPTLPLTTAAERARMVLLQAKERQFESPSTSDYDSGYERVVGLSSAVIGTHQRSCFVRHKYILTFRQPISTSYFYNTPLTWACCSNNQQSCVTTHLLLLQRQHHLLWPKSLRSLTIFPPRQ